MVITRQTVGLMGCLRQVSDATITVRLRTFCVLRTTRSTRCLLNMSLSSGVGSALLVIGSMRSKRKCCRIGQLSIRIPRRWRTFKSQRRQRRLPQNSEIELVQYGQTVSAVEETVAEMHLGDSFYLIEITGPDGCLRYSLEYQGTCDGPCIDGYIQSLKKYAEQEGCFDCSHIYCLI